MTESPDLTPMYFFLWGLVKDTSTSPRYRQHYMSQDRDQRGLCKHYQEILHNVWQEAEYRFDVARTTRGAHTELHLWQITVHKTFPTGLL
jgi:hypothetical protein